MSITCYLLGYSMHGVLMKQWGAILNMVQDKTHWPKCRLPPPPPPEKWPASPLTSFESFRIPDTISSQNI